MFICTALLKYSLNGCSIGFMVIFSRDIDKVCSREVPKFHRNFKMYNAEWPSQQQLSSCCHNFDKCKFDFNQVVLSCSLDNLLACDMTLICIFKKIFIVECNIITITNCSIILLNTTTSYQQQAYLRIQRAQSTKIKIQNVRNENFCILCSN